MIGAMPAVAVRHERRRQEKRGTSGGSHGSHHPVGLSSRPSQLYVGGVWPPPHSPCSTSPSPGGDHHSPDDDRFPEYYVCGKVSALQLVVGSLLIGAIVLVVGLVQLTPGADAADHRFILMGAGLSLIILGLLLTIIRCCCIHCPRHPSQIMVEQAQGVSSIDQLMDKNGVVTSPSELDVLIKNHTNNHHQESNGHTNLHCHHHQNNIEIGSTSSDA